MTLARDYFTDEHELRQLCGDAQSQARSESAQQFAADMVQYANREGLNMFLSAKQLDYLCTLAGWNIPEKVI